MIDLYSYFSENLFQFFGVLFSIIYVVFSIKQNILCWPALIFGSIFNMLAYYQINLNLQLIMQFFFIGTGVIGWLNWNKIGKENMLKVNRIALNNHILWIYYSNNIKNRRSSLFRSYFTFILQILLHKLLWTISTFVAKANSLFGGAVANYGRS